MISELINYVWLLFFRYFYAPERAIEGKYVKSSIGVVVAYFVWDHVQKSRRKSSLLNSAQLQVNKEEEPSAAMSDMQVSIPQSGTVSAANREEESESVEETTLTEVTKDLGDSKMHQKTATFEGQENTSLVEDNRTQKTESSKNVMQQETTTVSANKKVFSSKVETSESFSMEETEEFEIEG